MIVSWSHLLSQKTPQEIEELKKKVQEICLLSAEKKTFEDEAEKVSFSRRWLGQYLEKWPLLCLLYFEGDSLLGYIVGCPDTGLFLDKLDQPGLYWWKESLPSGFSDFPVHLHINCHPSSRGKGVGGKLLSQFEQTCLKQGLSSVHLITVKGARNVGFYEKSGYQVRGQYNLEQTALVFLGKNLSNS